MFDLTQFYLRDMSKCGLALAHIGKYTNTIEEASNRIIQYLYENLISQDTKEKSCVLIRMFQTIPYKNLTPDLQEYASKSLNNQPVTPNLKCLTLLATAGEKAEWNSRQKSSGHKAIPLVNKEAIAKIPMISQLIHQLGLEPDKVLQPDPNLLVDLEQKMYNVFYVADALGSPYIPAQESFVIPFNVKSVIGFGGLLPSGNMFVILMFLKVKVPRDTIDLLKPLALSVKMAILPFDQHHIFSNCTVSKSDQKDKDRIGEQLQSENSTLKQLLDVSKKSTLTQSDGLEKAIKQLQQSLEKVQEIHVQLLQTEKMSSLGQLVGDVADEINNSVSFIYGNLALTNEYTKQLLILVELYQQHYPEQKKEIQEYIHNIDLEFLKEYISKIISSTTIAATPIFQVIDSLSNPSRPDRAELKRVDIHEGIESTLLILNNRLKSSLSDSAIQVIKDYAELPLIDCYPERLNQVFINLLNNSIDSINEYYQQKKYSKVQDYSGIIQISTKFLDQDWVEISITDNGIGLKPETQKKIFEPFFTTKAIGQGIGLGLSVSYQIIVEKHQGKLSCISTPNNGAQFIIKIPIRQ
ncbi:MAG: HAMP domain-containing sensor histidine kinase [Microcoleaceae cyanobacterium]